MAQIRRTDVSLRRDSRSNRVHDRVQTPAYWPAPSQAVLLIHGYRTGIDRAETNYDRFEDVLDRMLAEKRRRVDLVGLSWPGDTPVPVINGFYFAAAHRRADLCTEKVVSFLRGGGPRAWREVVIVAHSLGCYLATEVAGAILRGPEPRPNLTLVLMAAAIPVEADYRILRQCRVCVLYSPDDMALGLMYRIGQRLVEKRLLPGVEAVGLNGRPETGTWDLRDQMRGYDHGHYWPGHEAVHRVCEFLGWIEERGTSTRDEPEARLPVRALPEPRNLTARHLGDRFRRAIGLRT